MKFTNFTIHKYKAVQNVEISLRNDLIPIIGVNESGKTSILQAIFAFSSYNDSFGGGNHLNSTNRYEPGSKDYQVSASIKFDDENEFRSIVDELTQKDDSIEANEEIENVTLDEILTQFQGLHSLGKPFTLTRDLVSYFYYIQDVNAGQYTAELAEIVLKRSPYILYFDDFTDRVPDEILFPTDYDENDSLEKKRAKFQSIKTGYDEWHSYVEEMFRRIENGVSLEGFFSTDDENDRSSMLSDVQDQVHKDIIESWQNLTGGLLSDFRQEISDELEGLNLNITHTLRDNQHVFQFKVIDKQFGGRGRYFPIIERSKGFQWFFNFAIKLKYNPKYTETSENAIFLLDEPGSYLHSSALQNLLSSLQEIAQHNQVIYCTHSQYLLDPDIVNINNIKICVRDESKIELQNFSEYREAPNNLGALSPLYDALQLKIGSNPLEMKDNLILTEGITDYYLFRLFADYTDYFLRNVKHSIIPGAGADNLKDLISLLIARSERYVVLFDGDKQGKAAYTRYEKYFGTEQSKYWLHYSTVADGKLVKLEELLTEVDRDNLVNLVSAKSVKNAIPLLFFGDEDQKSKLFGNLETETRANIENLSAQIEAIFV